MNRSMKKLQVFILLNVSVRNYCLLLLLALPHPLLLYLVKIHWKVYERCTWGICIALYFSPFLTHLLYRYMYKDAGMNRSMKKCLLDIYLLALPHPYTYVLVHIRRATTNWPIKGVHIAILPIGLLWYSFIAVLYLCLVSEGIPFCCYFSPFLTHSYTCTSLSCWKVYRWERCVLCLANSLNHTQMCVVSC